MATPAQPDNDYWYQIQTGNDTNSCMTVRPEVSDPNLCPIRMEHCSSAGDYSLWWFQSNGDGRFYMYNKGYPGTTSRLSFVAANQYTPLMKPTTPDAKHLWLLNGGGSSDTLITNDQHPGMSLSRHVVNDTIITIYLTPSTDGDSSSRNWTLDRVSEVEASSSAGAATSSAGGSSSSTIPKVPTGTESSSLPSTTSSDSNPIAFTLPLGLGLGLGLGLPLFSIVIWYYVQRYKRHQNVKCAEAPTFSPLHYKSSNQSIGLESLESSDEVNLKNDFSATLRIEDDHGGFKPFPALLDTGCQVGNWVSKEVVEKLGKSKEVLPYTKSLQATGIDGQCVEADNCITLEFSIQGGNPRHYKELFLIRPNMPREVIIGATTLAKYNIVQQNKHAILPVMSHKKPTEEDRIKSAEARKRRDQEVEDLKEAKKDRKQKGKESRDNSKKS